MIDWHSHILPGIDDGSRDVAESISLINMQMSQGIKTVIATPHYYANDESIESFLDRRQKAFDLLSKASENLPEIKLGAEVQYYQGISRLNNLKALCIEGTNLLLLEMPMIKWTEYIVTELAEVSSKNGIQIILAHVERYYFLQKQEILKRIYENGILTQVNAGFFVSLANRHKAISLLKKGKIHFLGSDCHNKTSRPPKIHKAFEIIQKKFGNSYISMMNEYGYSMLEHK